MNIHYYFYYLSTTPEAWLQEVSISVQDAFGDATQSVAHSPAIATAAGSLLEIQTRGPHLTLLNPNL